LPKEWINTLKWENLKNNNSFLRYNPSRAKT